MVTKFCLHLMKKIFKMIALIIAGIVLLVVVATAGVLYLHPAIGGTPSEVAKTIFASSENYEAGKFKNAIPTSMEMGFTKFMSILRDQIKGTPNKEPLNPVPMDYLDSLNIVQHAPDITRLTWFGHSAFLLEMAGKKILLDPMLGESPAPLQWLGPKRYHKELPIEIAQLPQIDAVIFSHDHYDHLDYGSVMALKGKVKEFYTPLGVGSHLEAWGVKPEQIHELDWWEEVQYGNIRLVCTPSRHFSGRALTDRFNTLWSSWVIQSATENIYFSGDSGYGPHFKEIGDKYGPFDFAMMECGQYDERWDNIHMMPEETAQAGVDVQAALLMPIHWGTFTLALHSWTDPIERVTKKAAKLNLPLTTPKIGEPILLDSIQRHTPNEIWWQ